LGENLFKQLEPYGIKVRNLRLFNIVGKYQSPYKGVFPKFIHNILMDKECLVTDTFRSYTLIDELIQNIEKINDGVLHLKHELENSGKIDIVRDQFSLTGKKLYEYIFSFLKAESIIVNQELKFKEVKTNEIKFRGDPNIDFSYDDFIKEFGLVIKEIAMDFKESGKTKKTN
jgi:nucleoside-diphosphate-sugar epimerase